MATKIDIISGFLGAGKTTLIKKLLKEAYADEQVVLIENGRERSRFMRGRSSSFQLILRTLLYMKRIAP